jgi:hypothetical protein
MRAVAGVLLAGALCTSPAPAQGTWQFEQPLREPRTAFLADRRAAEASGVAVSRTQPGVLWTHNDSGNDPALFAFDTLGRSLGMFRVVGAINVDWEAIRAAPCAGGSCLFIADIGDNTSRRGDVVVYRLPEPRIRPDSLGPMATARATALRIRYPDGPHDAEAMIITPIGDLLLITKGDGGARVYRVSLAAWDSPATAQARLVGTLPIPVDPSSSRLVTDAALAPDGVRVVVRTYRDLFFFQLAADRLLPAEPARACNVLGLEMQGEGVDWLDSHTLVLTSEKALAAAASVSLVECGAAQ